MSASCFCVNKHMDRGVRHDAIGTGKRISACAPRARFVLQSCVLLDCTRPRSKRIGPGNLKLADW